MTTSRTTKSFERLVERKGANITWHRENNSNPCPCQTRLGFRDPAKHLAIWSIVSGHSTTPDTNHIMALPTGTVLTYLFMPLIVSDLNITGYIGPGKQIQVNYVPGLTTRFDIEIPKALQKNLQQIDVWRSGDDETHFENVGTITPDMTEFVDGSIFYRSGSMVPYNQVDVLECNDDAMIPIVDERRVKGFVQPAFISTRSRSDQILLEAFGEMQADDHIGVFPLTYDEYALDFSDWSDAGSDWLEWNGLRFIAVTANLLPAPDNANVNHHWEVALRRINQDKTNENLPEGGF